MNIKRLFAIIMLAFIMISMLSSCSLFGKIESEPNNSAEKADAVDLDVQAALDGLVALIDNVVDGLAVEAVHRDFSVGQALAVTADEDDLISAEVQVVGQVVS